MCIHIGGGFTRVLKPHIQLKAGGRSSGHQSKATKQSVVDDNKLSGQCNKVVWANFGSFKTSYLVEDRWMLKLPPFQGYKTINRCW